MDRQNARVRRDLCRYLRRSEAKGGNLYDLNCGLVGMLLEGEVYVMDLNKGPTFATWGVVEHLSDEARANGALFRVTV